MATSAIFPHARPNAGLYEAFFVRAVSPHEPVGVWLRHTVHKAPEREPHGSVWCTVFDARAGRPFMHKTSGERLRAGREDWIAIGSARMRPGRVEGSCGPARWSLRYTSTEPELRHLSPSWLYRAPVPRTKLTSPSPAATFNGTLELPDRPAIELRDWPGMVGHNWGSEHAERWVWLHGVAFGEARSAWLDVALGRVRVGGRLTPWVANGALSLGGTRHHLGGLAARATVREDPSGCTVELSGERGLRVGVRASVPAGAAAGWRYADPSGGEHDVVNCSVSTLALDVSAPDHAPLELHSEHSGAYELGMRERDHGVELAPFSDG